MPEPAAGATAREADVFGRYLVGRPATAAQAAHYAAGHARFPPSPSRFERAQVALARMHPVLARAADAYGRFFAPRSLLRHKLVLLLAVLESSAPTQAAFAPRGAGPVGALARVAGAGALFAAHLVLGVLLLGPVHLALSPGGRR